MKPYMLKMTARRILFGKWARAVVMSAFLSLLSFGISSILTPFTGQTSTRLLVLGAAIALILELLTQVFRAGMISYFLKTARGEDAPFSEFIAGFRMQPDRFLIVGLVEYAVLLLLGLPCAGILWLLRASRTVLIATALLLGLLAGVLFAVFKVRIALSVFLLVDDPELGAAGSLRESSERMRGSCLRYVRLHLSFLGWYALELLSMGMCSFWIQPYVMETCCVFYMDLMHEVPKLDGTV